MPSDKPPGRSLDDNSKGLGFMDHRMTVTRPSLLALVFSRPTSGPRTRRFGRSLRGVELLDRRQMLAGDAYPYVESIQFTGSTPTSTSVVSYAVTFNEPVAGVDANDFQLVLSQVGPGAKIDSIVPASNFYASAYTVQISGVAVSGTAASGTLGLNLVDNGSIHSAANLPLRNQSPTVSFAQQRQFATGLRPLAVAQGDLNGDRTADLVVANANRNTVSVLLGKGDGSFLPQQMFATGLRPGGVTLGDFNTDGKADLAVANAGDNTVSVLLGKGDGSFLPQQRFAASLRPSSIMAGDFNSDGTTDLVVTNAGRNTVSVLLGKGDGSFLPQQMFAAGLTPSGVTLGDWNTDGKVDLAVANRGGNTVSVLLGKGDGSFLPQQRFATGMTPGAIAAGDLDGDDRTDLAITNAGGNTVSVLLGKGDGSFLPQQRFRVGLTPSAVAIGDFDGDGKRDLAITNAGGNTVDVLPGKGDGSFSPRQRFATGLTPSAVAFSDFNKDGRLDLAVANAGRNTVSVLLNNANGNTTGDVATIVPPQVLPVTLGNWSPKDHYLHPSSPTDWWWNTGTLTTKDGRTFGFEINAASFRYEGPLTQGFGFTQVLLTDVQNDKVYQSSTRYLSNKLALNIPVLDGSGTYDPTVWAESDSTKPWSVSLGGGLTGIANQLSTIDVVAGGSLYSPATKVTIEPVDGNGSGAKAQAVIRDGRVVQIQLLSAGTGYTAPPTVTIEDAVGSGALARAQYEYVTMTGPANDPTSNMQVKALMVDDKTNTNVLFDLTLAQDTVSRPPLSVFGTGAITIIPPNDLLKPAPDGTNVFTNNYYYSLTQLQASGSITIGGETFDVAGVTWQDHEWGLFTTEVNWILQPMQLDNGVSISNYYVVTPNTPVPALGQKIRSHATVQRADKSTYYVDSYMTPVGRTWTSVDTGRTYYMTWLVDIPAFNAHLTVTSLVDAQEFLSYGIGAAETLPPGVSTPPLYKDGTCYEGIASVSGYFENKAVRGTAWNEQTLPKPVS